MFRSLLAFLFLLSVSASDGRERILHDHDHKGGIHCLKPMEHELTFNNLAQALFVEHLMPPGDILDIGAEFGEWSCMYACFGHHSNRSVIAVEPSIREFERMVKCNYPNIKKFNKGMGAVHSRIQFDADRIGMVQELSLYYNSNGNVEITTVDDFFMKELQSFPGFMHIDVEGNELDLLKGAQQIIKNYSPIIAFEVHLLYNETFTKEILTYTAQMGGGYELYMINEICGGPQLHFAACRNIFAFPKSLISHLTYSPTLSLAIRSNILARITVETYTGIFLKLKDEAHPWVSKRAFGEKESMV